jgi:putative endonuclease
MSDTRRPCVYILASQRNGTLYIGVTADVARRVWEHRSRAVPGFTQRYGVDHLVYVEFHDSMEAAIVREKRLKKWRRAWKLAVIEHANPPWRDLYNDLPL